MEKINSTRWWIAALALLLLVALSVGVINAQTGGSITVTACVDQNADGDCDDEVDGEAPPDLQVCLNDTATCQPVPATFSDLAPGSYTPFLYFVGASQGYYPTTPGPVVELGQDQQLDVTLGAVYPVHPKGVAIHEDLNKVYVAFQGPLVFSEATTAATDTVATRPYPFVAVIDGETDEVLQTIPGGEDSIGREPWGVAVSGDNVYVGSHEEGRITVIDAISDSVVANIEPARDDFQPTSPDVNPVTGWVNFPDFAGGRVVVVDGTELRSEPLISDEFGFSPFELVIAESLQGYSFVTMRDTVLGDPAFPNPFQLRGFIGDGPVFGPDVNDIEFDVPAVGARTVMPHAIGLWQEEGMAEPRLFITYADDTRQEPNPPEIINPNKVLIFTFSAIEPKNASLLTTGIEVGDYAEVGLVRNPVDNLMIGTFGGFGFDESVAEDIACDTDARGGTYRLDFDGTVSDGPLPNIAVGNPPLISDELDWKNPFEVAVNSTNGKIYVTDRCFNDFPEGGQPGGGAVLVFAEGVQPPSETPTPTPSVTPTAAPNELTLTFEGPSNVDTGETFPVQAVAQNVPEPGIYGAQFEITYDPTLVSVISDSLQINPNLDFVVFNNVDNVTGKITLVASRQGDFPGLTGDVTLLTFAVTAADVNDIATFAYVNEKIGDPEALAFDVIKQDYMVTITQGATPTPESTPATETPTPTGTPDTPTPTHTPDGATPTNTPDAPTPTVTGTPATATPTPAGPTPTGTPATDTPTPIGPTPTGTPATETPTPADPTPTGTPATATPTGTVETPTPTGTPATSTPTPAEPTATGTPATATPTPTPDGATPTGTPDTPTPTGTPATATPTSTPSGPTPTGTPPTATPTPDGPIVVIILGQAVLPGQAGNNWSGATVTIDDTDQSAVTGADGRFTIPDVSPGVHSSISIDAPGYLSATCASPNLTSPETTLETVTLLSGDINGDDVIDVGDATGVGASFGSSGSDLIADINRDGDVDIFDIILASINFGTTGPQEWTCLAGE